MNLFHVFIALQTILSLSLRAQYAYSVYKRTKLTDRIGLSYFPHYSLVFLYGFIEILNLRTIYLFPLLCLLATLYLLEYIKKICTNDGDKANKQMTHENETVWWTVFS